MNGAPVVDINSSQSSQPGMPQPPRMPVPAPMPTPALNQTLGIFDRQPLPPGVSTVYIILWEATQGCRGGSRIFFRRGCTRLLLYFSTNKPHSFFCRIPVVLENCKSSRGQGGGGGAHALHPPPRSAPGDVGKEKLSRLCYRSSQLF